MALPSFFSRVADSLRPVAEVDPEILRMKLDRVVVRIEMRSTDPNALAAFDLAANLCARLYPRIQLLAPADVVAVGSETVLAINPLADIDAATPDDNDRAKPPNARLVIGHMPPTSTPATPETEGRAQNSTITINAQGWRLAVDTEPLPNPSEALLGHPLAWLAAAAIGTGELFRTVFADELGERGRRAPQPGGFNLITGTPEPTPTDPPPAPSHSTVDLGDVHLIGAGAIGQAAAYALATTSTTGRLHVVDPESVTLSNLQRYLLTDANSLGDIKSTLVAEALSATNINVEPFVGRWGDRPEHLGAPKVIVALDTAHDRITVAGTLPEHTYNAWTQVADLGWSRHENFGAEPCLACLYYPDRPKLSEHELIAEALHQPPLRVLAYLSYHLPIGFPLPGIPALAELPPRPGDERWLQIALINDLVAAGVINDSEFSAWSGTTIGALYRDGICAGGLMPVGDLPGDVLVPLAHQSALAGIMLAVELVSSIDPQLRRARDTVTEHRYDVLRGFPQILARPRQRTPHCICSDPAYLAAGQHDLAAAPE